MFDWKPTWWEIILMILLMIISNIICFPCFILQTCKIKMKRHANWLCKNGFDQLTFYSIYSFKGDE